MNRHLMFQHCQPMSNHHREQLQEGNGKISSEKVSGQSSSIQLVHPLYTSIGQKWEIFTKPKIAPTPVWFVSQMSSSASQVSMQGHLEIYIFTLCNVELKSLNSTTLQGESFVMELPLARNNNEIHIPTNLMKC